MLLQLVAFATPDLIPPGNNAAVAGASSHPLFVANSVLQTVNKALQQVDDLNLKTNTRIRPQRIQTQAKLRR